MLTRRTSVPGHDHDTIGYALDAGASIMVPQVSTVEEARHIVSAAKVGKAVNGTRSAPPGRWIQGYSDAPVDPSLTLWENLNHQAAIIIQVESEAAVRALDAILADPLAGPHIDAVWFGTLDARVSMGLPGFWGAEPQWLELLGVFEENSPLRRTVTIDDVGNVAAFLLSDLAGGISAEIMYVDGGFSQVAMTEREA